jgi:hypothetical protein
MIGGWGRLGAQPTSDGAAPAVALTEAAARVHRS